MGELSALLFVVGTVTAAVAFAAHVGDAVLVANGRRIAPPVPPAPAWAAAGVAGTFVGVHATAPRQAPEGAPGAIARLATASSVLAVALLGGSLGLRAILVGRGPYGNLHEFSIAFATAMLAGWLLLARRRPVRQLGAIPAGIALALLLYAASLPARIEPLVPALQNAPLLTVHVGTAVVAYGILATAFAAGLGYLAQGSEDRFAWLPSHRTLDELAWRAVVVGFPLFALMIVLGSWWASIAWSRYWGWDPKETSALVTWLTYAIYLHARNRRRWAGRPAALLLVAGFVMVLVTYSGSLWFSGLHAYSGL